jgi:hypothetical protein
MAFEVRVNAVTPGSIATDMAGYLRAGSFGNTTPPKAFIECVGDPGSLENVRQIAATAGHKGGGITRCGRAQCPTTLPHRLATTGS